MNNPDQCKLPVTMVTELIDNSEYLADVNLILNVFDRQEEEMTGPSQDGPAGGSF